MTSITHCLPVLHVDDEGKGYYSDFGSMEKLAEALTQVFVYDGFYSAHRREGPRQASGDALAPSLNWLHTEP